MTYEAFRAQFLSTYKGESDYHVYVPRLQYNVRVRVTPATGAVIPLATDDCTPAEAMACIMAVCATRLAEQAEADALAATIARSA